MKSLRLLTLSVFLLAAGQTFAQPKFSFFRPPAAPDRVLTQPDGLIIRAQSGGVPLPQNAGSAGNMAAQTQDAGAAKAGTADPDGALGAGTSSGLPDGSSLSVPAGSAPVTGAPPTTWNAFSPPLGPDPFANPGVTPYAPYSPYGTNPMNPYAPRPFSVFGTNGPSPYRQGLQSKLAIEWLPISNVSAGGGDIGQFGVDYDLGISGPFLPGWVYTWTKQFGLRTWHGPNGTAPSGGLPGTAFRFAGDFEIETPNAGPVGLSLAITPSLNTDFDSTSSDAFQLDGRGMFVFQLDQAWSLVLGAGYWDRLNDRVIPYAGLIYRNDYWEWRVMYPETTISAFMGNGPAGSAWMYVRAEYNVEAYEISTPNGTDQVELEDYRVMLGIRTETGTSSWFIEGGIVFDRDIEYGRAANTALSPDSSFIGRMGWRY